MAQQVPVVRLIGEYDVYSASALAEMLQPITGRGIVDLTAVRYLDSAGLAQLARLANRVGPHAVVLVAPNPQIRRVLALARFDRLFVVVDELDDARRVL
ncbi:STAS domain-containing protein [Vulcanimicrobium alpinum]|uniref:STAS domain-containing protein n=1 Tax=Vulcanimicrobium alpinum TaxID=3016050 RepID=UPI00295E9A32|nr:STAS domain-containing protein [Vulcanimicrobium alpinum]